MNMTDQKSDPMYSPDPLARSEAAHANSASLARRYKRERDAFELALRQIASGMGNLSLEQIGPKGVIGPNDGKQRAIYLEAFIKIARDALGITAASA